ncbi:MAG: DUF47 domain-containing protein [Chloroflexi bacterium]|nr:DUF47 domain-containing protein [Chloroflexota bacterium]
MPKFSFIPKEQKFFDLFEESARNVVNAAKALKDMVDNWEYVEAKGAEIAEIEHRGDTITHQIAARLNRTFITPFDREDIAKLMEALDDVTDFIDAACDSMLIYKVGKPDQRAKELADIIVQSATRVEEAVCELRHPAGFKKTLALCVEINRLENMADRVLREAMGELFENTADIANIIKWREIYNHMETATDRCEDVANVLEGVALKHA